MSIPEEGGGLSLIDATVVRSAKTAETGGVRPTPLAAVLLPAALAGCWTQTIGGPAQTSGGADGGTVTSFRIAPSDNQLDLLFVIDDSGAAAAQQKLTAQVPALLQAIEQLPGGLPDLHVGVVSTDLGAGPDAPTGCTATGDGGQFQSAARGSCAASTLAHGAAFISNSYGAKNFTDPIENVVQCILPLGTSGCGFAQPLAALARALGADGADPPEINKGFLRPNAGLAIVILSAVDDCSTRAGSDLFQADPSAPGLSDPLGPLTHYRCNRFGHLCTGGGTMRAPPPLDPLSLGPDDNGAEQLSHCVSNDAPDGPVARVGDIAAAVRKLKPRPDDQIAVAAIVAPPAPYAVRWTPAGGANPQNPDELWPSVMLSCGAAGDPAVNPATMAVSTDGSSGEPAVRIAEFVQSFQRGQIASICDPSYNAVAATAAARLADVARGVTCSPGPIPGDARQQPACTVTANDIDTDKLPGTITIANCAATAGELPCWTAGPEGASSCAIGSRPFYVDAPGDLATRPGLIYDVSCSL